MFTTVATRTGLGSPWSATPRPLKPVDPPHLQSARTTPKIRLHRSRDNTSRTRDTFRDISLLLTDHRATHLTSLLQILFPGPRPNTCLCIAAVDPRDARCLQIPERLALLLPCQPRLLGFLPSLAVLCFFQHITISRFSVTDHYGNASLCLL